MDKREFIKEQLCKQIDSISDEELDLITGGDGPLWGLGPRKEDPVRTCPVCGTSMPMSALVIHTLGEHPDYYPNLGGGR